jgi:hypothetical protein
MLSVRDPARTAVADANLTVVASASTATKVGVSSSVVGIIKEVFETSAGAFEVHGAIRDKYLALGAEASILGYPRTDETGTPDGVGRFNHFQGGSIYWTPGTSAHEVHGLIRDRWASLGWERNPQLGYQVTDELIPDPRVGHRRPETRKKPVLTLPSDVIKLPADAAAAGFPSSVINSPLTSVTQPAAPAATSVAASSGAMTIRSSTGVVGKLSDKTRLVNGGSAVSAAVSAELQPALTAIDPGRVVIDPSVIGTFFNTPASTPADHRSVNRFADFENGVLFWFRGATSAATLSPLASTNDGTSMSFSGADIAAATVNKIGKANFETGNAQLASMTFVGTTGYSFDGAQVHNRRHRLQLILQGVENQPTSGPFGISIPQLVPVTATIELQVEVWFDGTLRQIVLALVDWNLIQSTSGSYADAVRLGLHGKLDALLWRSFELLSLPDTDGGAPIAVLSVKTLPNGAVSVFVEPRSNSVLGSLSQIANAVSPSVLVFSQPN